MEKTASLNLIILTSRRAQARHTIEKLHRWRQSHRPKVRGPRCTCPIQMDDNCRQSVAVRQAYPSIADICLRVSARCTGMSGILVQS